MSKKGNVKSLYNHWAPLTELELSTLALDFEKFCAEGSLIINKNSEAVPFVLNEAQRVVAKAVLKDMFIETPAPRVLVIHKCRQAGISVVMAKLEQYLSTRLKSNNTIHLFPTDDLASKFYEEKMRPLLEGTHPSLLSDIYATTSRNIYMKFNSIGSTVLNSYIKIGGALSKGAQRSSTNQMVIFDEYAYYEKVTQLEKGVLATQPKTGRVLTVYVSTANGINHFYDTCKIGMREDTSMEYIFLPWHMLKEYEKPVKSEKILSGELTDYQKFLLTVFEDEGYPVETWGRKLQWYEDTLNNEAKGDMEYMYSEYPSISDESFNATGNPVFSAPKLLTIRNEIEDLKPIYIDIQHAYDDKGRPRVEWVEVPDSPIKVYSKPVKYRRYLMGVDPSEGTDRDFSSVVIIDEENMEEVCSFDVKMEQPELADLCVQLAKYYGNAIIVPERNMGNTLIEFIKTSGYHRLWVDPQSTRNYTQFGIRMTRHNKGEAIRRMKFFINNDIWKFRDLKSLDDMLHFAWKITEGGFAKAVAQGSDQNNKAYHDDTVMARLNLCLMLDMRRFKGYAEYTKNVR